MITPKFLQEQISSPEYDDKNSETYKWKWAYILLLAFIFAIISYIVLSAVVAVMQILFSA